MENDKNVLLEKVMHLSMLLRRLSAPRFGNEGPRGRSQERALTQIALREGISQRELLEKLGIQPSSMSELLGKLERGGMIERRMSDEDHRQVNLYLKESGRKYLERVNDADRNLIPFDALSDEEAESFGAMLDKLIENAESACADKGLPMYPPRPREGSLPDLPFGPHAPGFRPPMPGHPGFGRPGNKPSEGYTPSERGSDYRPEGREGTPFRRPRPPFKGEPARLPNLSPRRGIGPEELRFKAVKLGEDKPQNDSGDGIQLAETKVGSDPDTHRI